MAIQTINVGNLVNDGLGDDLRTAFQKVNNNFNVLTTELTVTGQNIGTAGVGIFKQKTDENLQLKKLAAGDSTVVIIDDTATDTVKITAPLQNAFTSIIAGSEGAVSATTPTSSVSLVAGDNIRITKAGQNITISADLLSGELLGNLQLNSYNIIGTGDIDINGTITANNFVGTVNNIDVRPINSAVFDFDFGKIVQGTYANVVEFLFTVGDYDLGTITSPSEINLDLGTI
jgi:hypothetical protein